MASPVTPTRTHPPPLPDALRFQEWAAKARPDAETRLRVDMVLGEATKKLDVNPTTEEVYSYLLTEAAKDEELRGEVDKLTQNRNAVEYFRHRLTRLKTLEKLVGIASGEKLESKKEGA